jgi:hypothetical protein
MSDMAIYRQRLSLSPSLSPKSRLNVRKVLTLPVVLSVCENCRLSVSMINRQPSCVFHAIAPHHPKQSKRVDMQDHNVVSFRYVVIDHVGKGESVLAKQKAEHSAIRRDGSVMLEIPF